MQGAPEYATGIYAILGKALSQYEEETQRLIRIAQGAVEDATQTAREAQGRIEATIGNGRGATSAPEPEKASSSHRDSA
jgi:hypothetical protein